MPHKTISLIRLWGDQRQRNAEQPASSMARRCQHATPSSAAQLFFGFRWCCTALTFQVMLNSLLKKAIGEHRIESFTRDQMSTSTMVLTWGYSGRMRRTKLRRTMPVAGLKDVAALSNLPRLFIELRSLLRPSIAQHTQTTHSTGIFRKQIKRVLWHLAFHE